MLGTITEAIQRAKDRLLAMHCKAVENSGSEVISSKSSYFRSTDYRSVERLDAQFSSHEAEMVRLSNHQTTCVYLHPIVNRLI